MTYIPPPASLPPGSTVWAYLRDSGGPVGDKYVAGAYYNRRTFQLDYALVDRIMLSIKTR